MQFYTLASLLVPLAAVGAQTVDAQTPVEAGFEMLFDGSTLNGWVTKGGRYDGNARWTVEDGTITGREGLNGEGGLIYTEKQYRNFVFKCQCRISHPFDSGIFLRMVPRSGGSGSGGGKGGQVTIDYRPGGEVLLST